MDATWAVGADSWKKVPPAETNKRILHLAAITGKEDGASSGSVADTQHITLFEYRTKGRGCKRIIMRFVTV